MTDGGRGEAIRVARCRCGRVRFEAHGAPIVTAVCYCASCQAGGALIEALPDAPPVRDADGGTPYLTYRDDRWRCVEGKELLDPYRLAPDAPTERFVARCCHSGMFVKYGPGFWVSTYRHRYAESVPAVEFRNQTRHRTSMIPLPDDAPSFPGFPLGLFSRLAKARLAMWFGR